MSLEPEFESESELESTVPQLLWGGGFDEMVVVVVVFEVPALPPLLFLLVVLGMG